MVNLRRLTSEVGKHRNEGYSGSLNIRFIDFWLRPKSKTIVFFPVDMNYSDCS